jgi:hypothetical protein
MKSLVESGISKSFQGACANICAVPEAVIVLQPVVENITSTPA